MNNLSTFVKRVRDIMRQDAGINGDAQRIEQIAWMLFLKVYDQKEEEWEFVDKNYISIIPEEFRWRNWGSIKTLEKPITGSDLLDFINNGLFPTLKGLNVTPDTPVRKAIVKTTFEDANNYMKDGVLLRQVANVIDEIDLEDSKESRAFAEIYESILKELQNAGSAGEFYTPRAVTDFMAEMMHPALGEKMADFACGTGGFLTSWLKALPQMKSTEDHKEYNEAVYGIEKKQFPFMLCVTNLLLHGLDNPRVYHENSLLHKVLNYTEKDRFDAILMNPPYGGNEKADVKNYYFPPDLASSETADLFMSVIMYRLKKTGRAAVILPDGFLFGTDNVKINIKKKLLNEFNLHTIIRLPGSVFSPYTSITTNILFFDAGSPTEKTWFYRLDMPEGYKHFNKTNPIKLEHFNPVKEWWHNREAICIDGFDKSKCFSRKELEEGLGYNLDQCGFPHKEEEILDPKDLIQEYREKRTSLNLQIDDILANISALLGESR